MNRRNSAILNEFVDFMKSLPISEELRSSLEDKDLVIELGRYVDPFVMEMLNFLRDLDKEDQAIILHNNFANLMKNFDRLRSLLQGLNEELESLYPWLTPLPDNATRDFVGASSNTTLISFLENQELIAKLGDLEDSVVRELADFLDGVCR